MMGKKKEKWSHDYFSRGFVLIKVIEDKTVIEFLYKLWNKLEKWD